MNASTSCHAVAGDCSAGFRIVGIAGDERGRGHPARDGEREVPRRDDDGDAFALVGRSVAFARWRLHSTRGLALEPQHLAAVVLAEVDGLAHVARRPGPTACPPRTPRSPRAGCGESASTRQRGTAHRPARPPALTATVHLAGPPPRPPRRRRPHHTTALRATTRSKSPGSTLSIEDAVTRPLTVHQRGHVEHRYRSSGVDGDRERRSGRRSSATPTPARAHTAWAEPDRS